MRRLIEDIRVAIGHPPRRLEVDTFWRRPRPPLWMSRGDDLRGVYRQLKLLLREGEAVWGALVQANALLFRAGPFDHPAMTVYAADRPFDDRPGQLQAVARRLYDLKNTAPADPNERRLAEMITDERERGLGWTVPKGLTGGVEIRSTTFMVFRRHLPRRILQGVGSPC